MCLKELALPVSACWDMEAEHVQMVSRGFSSFLSSISNWILNFVVHVVLAVTLPYFDGRATYIAYPMLTNSFSTTSLYLEVRPASLDGLILVNYQLGGVDFIAIAMRDGIVELWYDLGQGPVTITSRTPVSLEEWHSILVSRSGRLGELMVDDAPAVSGTSPGSFTMLQVNSDLYVGGAPMPVSLPVELRSLSWFNGCIREIRTQVQGSTLDLIADAISGQGVSECPALDVCDVTTCSNNGICTNTVDSFVCECVPGFTGSRCEVDLCAVNSPCLNNGMCYAEDGDVLLCNCSAPFTGPTCMERKYQSPPPPPPHLPPNIITVMRCAIYLQVLHWLKHLLHHQVIFSLEQKPLVFQSQGQ